MGSKSSKIRMMNRFMWISSVKLTLTIADQDERRPVVGMRIGFFWIGREPRFVGRVWFLLLHKLSIRRIVFHRKRHRPLRSNDFSRSRRRLVPFVVTTSVVL